MGHSHLKWTKEYDVVHWSFETRKDRVFHTPKSVISLYGLHVGLYLYNLKIRSAGSSLQTKNNSVLPKLPVTAVRNNLSIWYLSFWSNGRIFSRTLKGWRHNKMLCEMDGFDLKDELLAVCWYNHLTVRIVTTLFRAWLSLILPPSVLMLIRWVRSWR